MKNLIGICLLSLLLWSACGGDDDLPPVCEGGTDLRGIEYNPVAYELTVPCDFPQMEIPADNPMEVDGIELGRFLFYDPILSEDSTMSCSSCHLPSGAFTDNLAVSTGIDGVAGVRSSMSLINVGFFYEGLFWDGRVSTLEEQALLPVEDPIELHNSWPVLEEKLRNHSFYPEMFRKAFGIDNSNDITKELAAKAIAQFERSLVSSGQAKYDRERCEPGVFYTPLELEGIELFSNETGEHPGCTHCHSKANQLFTDNSYRNNGLDSVGLGMENLNNFPDIGRGAITGILDNGKFRVTSLRNISLSGPYMHDGRFSTLEEVVTHYKNGGKAADNLDPNTVGFPLTDGEKAALLAFLNTLVDTVALNNPAYQNPFE